MGADSRVRAHAYGGGGARHGQARPEGGALRAKTGHLRRRQEAPGAALPSCPLPGLSRGIFKKLPGMPLVQFEALHRATAIGCSFLFKFACQEGCGSCIQCSAAFLLLDDPGDPGESSSWPALIWWSFVAAGKHSHRIRRQQEGGGLHRRGRQHLRSCGTGCTPRERSRSIPTGAFLIPPAWALGVLFSGVIPHAQLQHAEADCMDALVINFLHRALLVTGSLGQHTDSMLVACSG